MKGERFFGDGWRGFEFVVLKKWKGDLDWGSMMPYIIRIRFAYWLPFYAL